MSHRQPAANNFSGIKFILRAFRYRNYRLFFLGQGISLIGTWMQTIALSWLVYKLTGSAFLLGLVFFAGQIPTFILAPFAGVLADCINRRRILVITQTLAMVQAFLLAFLFFFYAIKVWQIMMLSTFLGLVNAFDIPARQAFVVDMVEKKEDLGNAIALNSLMFNSARLIGPSIAGILIAALGEGMCFLLNGLSFIAVIFALLLMRIPDKKARQRGNNVLAGLKEGFLYTFGSAPIRYALLLLSLVSILGLSYAVLMPVFVKDILGGGAVLLGLMMGATGVGALLGAIYLASRKEVREFAAIIPVSTVIFSLGIIAFSFSRSLWFSLLSMMTVGFGLIVQIASINTVIQDLTEDDKRGRVMSFFAMAFMGMSPFGSLLAGALAGKIGAPQTLLLSGLLCVGGALIYSRKTKLI